jgi:hypothetical protein
MVLKLYLCAAIFVMTVAMGEGDEAEEEEEEEEEETDLVIVIETLVVLEGDIRSFVCIMFP